MRAAAEQRGTRVCALGDLDGELLPADLLALCPYEEHPRNIALVARMAVELGLDPTLAIVTMAEHVEGDQAGEEVGERLLAVGADADEVRRV